MFKSLQVPKTVVANVIETLNKVQEAKVAFHDKELEQLTTEKKLHTNDGQFVS
ncbi:MAG: hypothetical protein P4L22_02145 [Candidatus Babeliales bacterium]|nr:hypothetical protein [Candidatus Babeliales bacterium]